MSAQVLGMMVPGYGAENAKLCRSPAVGEVRDKQRLAGDKPDPPKMACP
jgi:hypothetical protein